jgi:hypothetical protein
MMAQMPKATGTRGNIQDVVSGGLSENPPDGPANLASQGIDKNLAHKARKVAKMSDQEFADHVRGASPCPL